MRQGKSVGRMVKKINCSRCKYFLVKCQPSQVMSGEKEATQHVCQLFKKNREQE